MLICHLMLVETELGETRANNCKYIADSKCMCVVHVMCNWLLLAKNTTLIRKYIYRITVRGNKLHGCIYQ